jgi:CelD/BcsL family acetyltransferase involved in cellulose biosynthesis
MPRPPAEPTAAQGPASGLPAGPSIAPDTDELTREWDSLAVRLDATPFVRPGWMSAWWRAFGAGRLEVLTAGSSRGLDAVLPVAQRGATVSSPSNWHTPQYGLLDAGGPSAATLLDRLFARRAPQVSLGFLSSTGPDVPRLTAAAERAGYRVLVRPLARSPLVRIATDWDTYERSLSGNLRRDVGRCRRRLGELGRSDLDVHEDTGGLAEAFAIEHSGWKARAGSAIASQPETESFYTEIASWAAENGWLRLIFLRLDGRAIAFHLALEHRGAYFPLKGGFDPEFRALSPGKLIIHATLERAFTVGLERYEFLGAFDAYKRRWATDAYDRLRFQAFSSGPSGRVRRAAFVYGRPLAKRALAALGSRAGNTADHPE